MTGREAIVLRLRRFSGSAMPRRRCVYEFHIRAEVRRTYAFDETLYASTGNVIFPNFHAVRLFAKKLNDRRDLARHPERAVRAGELNAMGLIDEIFHFMLRRYEELENPGVIGRALGHAGRIAGGEKLEETLQRFGEQFPPMQVYRGKVPLREYLSGRTGGTPHREMALEEMILLWFANINPAFAPFKELFNDRSLREGSAYKEIVEALTAFFASEPPSGPGGVSILELLRAPMLASPHSLEGQLGYIRHHWGLLLSKTVLDKMAGAGDLIREETRIVAPGHQAETQVPRYTKVSPFGEIDEERFSADVDWMPNAVLLAKNACVWLDQLSKQYSRPVRTLDQIPDEELDRLARWNINALWLIGIWERSRASQTVKQMMGNAEAVASAYSLFDYDIARGLGGEASFENLRERCWRRGIRLAGDMVPNHVGVYSKWMIEHPGYFMQSDYSPFPNYSFTGTNLSDTPGIEIRIEDGYWTRRDAAVVFQRVASSTGEVRYIYHGNDGTHTPWNDTAQLDFLKPEVREAVIQAIFRVARKFPIIRFDAAMVLTKQHFQRLWYPQPGTGGDIPSRADHAMTKEAFDAAFPNEFWREVVDRINTELPNTLLLAEAFWLLEGYFVRTLGMHRVYNSAFMHMMMKEENAKYRELIANTLAFNPEILKRYVNFMSNPDERTAVDQFGREDKYFGVAMMMVTLPGLPMFAHGQIEGFTEKYGMEYQRAYYNEQPDARLVERHEREIFPVLRQRYLFSQVRHFQLYAVVDAAHHVLENIFCYSNRAGEERALFCYNNRYEASAGTIGGSVPKAGTGDAAEAGTTPGSALGLRPERGYYYILREHRTQLEYLRPGAELCGMGMAVSLQGYEYQLFGGFREVYDETGAYLRLSRRLEGRGVPGIADALAEMELEPVHRLLRKFAGGELAAGAADFWSGGAQAPSAARLPSTVLSAFRQLTAAASAVQRAEPKGKECASEFEKEMKRVRGAFGRYAAYLPASPEARGRLVPPVLLRIVCRVLENCLGLENASESLRLAHLLGHQERLTLEVLASHERLFSRLPAAGLPAFGAILGEAPVQAFLNVNVYEGITYFSKERCEELAALLLLGGVEEERGGESARAAKPGRREELAGELTTLAQQSGYRLEEFRRLLASSALKAHDEVPF